FTIIFTCMVYYGGFVEKVQCINELLDIISYKCLLTLIFMFEVIHLYSIFCSGTSIDVRRRGYTFKFLNFRMTYSYLNYLLEFTKLNIIL
ncbi:hypothetical protein ACJX0J_027248, partial [Zea mays]